MTTPNVPDNPLPLVTLTFTTDELAMTVAGLMQLRRFWAARAIDARNEGMASETERAHKTIQHITDYITRIENSVSKEQGSALLSELIRSLKRGD